MTEIDWNAPLEAVHDDGRVVSVTKSRGWDRADADGEYRLDGIPESMHAPYFSSTGRGDDPSWRIRNRTTKPANAPSPELVDKLRSMRDHLDLARNRIRATAINFTGLDEPRSYEASYWANEADEHVRNFDAILAELEPKPDADLELAREVAESYLEAFYDRDEIAGVALAAIKRVRAEK